MATTISASMLIQSALQQHVADEISKAKSELIAYANDKDFLNFLPRIGLEGQTELQPSITGLKATIPETYIFLGGYCSLMPESLVNLVPNNTNYIYLIRNRENRDVIDISIRQAAIGVIGENAFNRILIAQYTTNATEVTMTTYYPVALGRTHT